MIRRPPRSTRTEALFPYRTLFRSDAALVAVEHREITRPRPEQSPGVVAPDRLDLYDVGAEVGQHHAGGRPHDHMSEFDDPDPGERQVGVGKRECDDRSEEHTSELQSLMRISYAVFRLKKTINHEHTE